jgi:hypothetical protein
MIKLSAQHVINNMARKRERSKKTAKRSTDKKKDWQTKKQETKNSDKRKPA